MVHGAWPYPMGQWVQPPRPNPFTRILTVLIGLSTVWFLVYAFLQSGGLFIGAIPDRGDEGTGGGAGAFGAVCGIGVLVVSFFPLIISLMAAGRFPWLLAGVLSCWLSSILLIIGIGAYPIVLLMFLPVPLAATAGLFFHWLYGRATSSTFKRQ